MNSPLEKPKSFNLFEISQNGASTGGCSRYLFIPNWHETPNLQFDKESGPLRSPDGSSDGGFGGSCQFGMNKYLEHPPVEAPFWDISNKLKYFGSSKGEFIDYKFVVEMSLRSMHQCYTCPSLSTSNREKTGACHVGSRGCWSKSYLIRFGLQQSYQS